MATGVVFGQPSTFINLPGAYTKVDADALTIAQSFAPNVILLAGAAKGGKPLELKYFNDPNSARETFGANSQIGKAVEFAFRGGVRGGASLIIGVRVDQSQQASGILDDANDSGTTLAVTHKDWGAYGNTYSLSFREGSNVGTMAVVTGETLNGGEYYRKIDNYLNFLDLLDEVERQTPLDVEITQGGIKASAALTLTSTDPTNLVSGDGTYPTVAITIDDEVVSYATTSEDTLQDVGDFLAQLINDCQISDRVVATSAYDTGTDTSTITIEALVPGTRANGLKVEIAATPTSDPIDVSGSGSLVGGVDPTPPSQVTEVDLDGGLNSTPMLQDWLNLLEKVRYVPLRYLVPVGTDDIGVQAAFADHCTELSNTQNKRERVCILGHRLGMAVDGADGIRDRAEFFNNFRVVFASPGYKTSDPATGRPTLFPSHTATVATVAGVLAAEGNGVSDPITHTFLRNIIEMETEYEEGSIEVGNLIESGVCLVTKEPAMVRPSRGYRITRGINTYRGNEASLASISVINQSDFIAQSIRAMQEALFIGKPILPKTLELLREKVNKLLIEKTEDEYIYGFDSSFTKVSINPSLQEAVDVEYKIYPAPALEFILNTQLLFPIPTED